MNDLVLVTNENGVAMTSSLKIAEVFGKDHGKVLRSIREKQSLFNEANFGLVGLFNQCNFALVDYADEK